MVPHLILSVPDWFSLAWPDSMHDLCCTILQGGVNPPKDSWEMAFLKSGVSAQHGTRTFVLQRQNQRQRRERATRAERATRSPEAESKATRSSRSTGHCWCFFRGVGVWFEPQFPYHTTICSGGGGGGVSTSIPRPQSNWQQVWYLFLRNTTRSLVLGADRALHVRSP